MQTWDLGLPGLLGPGPRAMTGFLGRGCEQCRAMQGCSRTAAWQASSSGSIARTHLVATACGAVR